MRTAFAVLLSAAVALAVTGCNAILGNDPGVLAITDEAGTEPAPDPATAPEPAPTVPAPAPTVTDEDGGLTTSPAPAVAPDAGLTCPPCVIANGTGACQQGACVITSCTKEHADCNANAADGCEANLTNDPAHCGACGTVCPANATCKGKTCRPLHEP